MWTKFLPKFDVIRQIIDEGMLGQVHTVIATMASTSPPTIASTTRHWPGGPLLDLGTYPVSLAHFALGTPDSVASERPTRQLGTQRADLGDPHPCRR